MEKIPMTIRVSLETALTLLDLAHDEFDDSLGGAVESIVNEWMSTRLAAGGAT